MTHLVDKIANTGPSVNLEILKHHELINKEFQSVSKKSVKNKHGIGFN